MISKTHRFHTQGALTNVYRHGNAVRSTNLALKFVSNTRHQTWRAAVVVSKKVSKSAVVRNRIRRRIYAVVRQESNSIKPGHDLVFSVFNEQLATLSHEDLQKTVMKCLNDAQLLEVK